MAVESTEFHVNPSSDLPIFRQIIDQVEAFIASGRLGEGEMLPSTRDMARVLEVNMMTISKAYSKLESNGTALRLRGRGMQIVSLMPKGSVAERKRAFQSVLEPVVRRGRQLGLTDQQMLSVIKKLIPGEQL